MNPILRLALVICLIIYFACIFGMLKKKQLELKYTLLWIFSGLIMTVIVIFPQIIEKGFALIGIVDPVNGLLATIIFGLIVILMSMTAIVSKMNKHLRGLTQKCALYEKDIRELKGKIKNEDNN